MPTAPLGAAAVELVAGSVPAGSLVEVGLPTDIEKPPAEGTGAPPVGRLVGAGMTDPVLDAPVPLEPAVPLAVAWKALKDLSAVGFTANTIPAWQWLTGEVCAQWNQRGALTLLRVKLHEGNSVAFGWTSWKPESIPPVDRLHGAAKVDWVTEWFFARNSKWMVSPTWAVTCGGVKAN